MVEISLSGSGEGPGWATSRGYSTTHFEPFLDKNVGEEDRVLLGGETDCEEIAYRFLTRFLLHRDPPGAYCRRHLTGLSCLLGAKILYPIYPVPRTEVSINRVDRPKDY
jgi:hypothetical protein